MQGRGPRRTLGSGQFLLLAFAMITVFLTAFYTFRAYFMTFWASSAAAQAAVDLYDARPSPADHRTS